MHVMRWLGLGVLSMTVACLAFASCDKDCETHADCLDGLYCNGVELCVAGQCEDGELPCGAGDTCREDVNTCRVDCDGAADVDGDGDDRLECGGSDCDDEDARRTPYAAEVCDTDDLDEDCDPTTYGYRDIDGDGYGDANCHNRGDDGEVYSTGIDCDDTHAGVHPGLHEACNGLDDDCDGHADEGVLVPSYSDGDGDGWGQQADAEMLCAGTPGYANIPGDCDDELSEVHPGAFRCATDTGDSADIEFCTDEATWSDERCPGDGQCVAQPDGSGVCLPGGVPECSDTADNDTDGDVDIYDEDCSSPLDDSEAPTACSNGDDDDGDSFADYPNDPGCGSREDTIEDDPATPPECSNGLDDDNDGATDFAGGEGDQGCTSAADGSERQADGASCDNGVDDDGDSTADFPADKTCASAIAAEVPACSNGLDDDFDGTIDDAEDLGCTSALDDNERDTTPASNYSCDDGEDDDLDGVADYPGDPGCTGPADSTE